MPIETQLFFEEVLRHDLSLLTFIDSDWTMLNERLATLYGIPDVSGSSFQKVKLPPGCHRGGRAKTATKSRSCSAETTGLDESGPRLLRRED